MKCHELYQDKKDCCGCTACAAICPKNAIDMIPDEDGYENWLA